jgi:hypothetical protein
LCRNDAVGQKELRRFYATSSGTSDYIFCFVITHFTGFPM